MTDKPTVSSTSEPNGVQHKFVLNKNERSNTSARFPIRFAIAFFALAIATHALASGFWHWLENAVHSTLLAHLIMSLIALVACIVAATLLWNMRLETHHRRKTHLVFIMLIATLGAIGVVGICISSNSMTLAIIGSKSSEPLCRTHPPFARYGFLAPVDRLIKARSLGAKWPEDKPNRVDRPFLFKTQYVFSTRICQM
jgi:hypothetical protein